MTVRLSGLNKERRALCSAFSEAAAQNRSKNRSRAVRQAVISANSQERGKSDMKSLNLLLLVCLVSFTACAEKRPVLYPNSHLNQVGSQTAQADIDECMRLAKESNAAEDKGGKVAKDTAAGAVVGAAIGGAVGAVTGNFGQGLAAGAAGGGAGGLTGGAIRSSGPDPIFQRFVEKCLHDKGYEPIGWK
jgi:outer membrane lipoprotein SlyB